MKVVDYSHYKCLKIEVKDNIATVTLNKPELLNAVDGEMHSELEEIFGTDLANDGEVRVIILTGAGKAFSAGGDIRAMKEAADKGTWSDLFPPIHAPFILLSNLVNLPKPIIAAVNGHCMGIGATLALCCDICYVAEGARIGDPHVSVGLTAGDGGCVIWPLLIGLNRAKQFLLTGDSIEATEAERIGLINKAVPGDQLMPEAMSFAKRLVEGPPLAINYTKMDCNLVLRNRLNEILQSSIAHEWLTAASSDFREAVTAFLEKRKPNFTGT